MVNPLRRYPTPPTHPMEIQNRQCSFLFFILILFLAFHILSAKNLYAQAIGKAEEIPKAPTVNATSFSSLLQKARQAVFDKDQATAWKVYRMIPMNSSEFSQKIEDLTKWYLSDERPTMALGKWGVEGTFGEEAFKLILIAERLGVSWAQQKDHKVLAGIESGLCTLDWPMETPSWQALVKAYFYRYSHLFSTTNDWVDPFDEAARGRFVYRHSLHSSPTLREMAQVDGYTNFSLFRKRGCSYYEDDFDDLHSNPESKNHLEFLQLKKWWYLTFKTVGKAESSPQLRPSGSSDVLVRLLSLALEKVEDKKHIIAPESVGKPNTEDTVDHDPKAQETKSPKFKKNLPIRDQALADRLLQDLHPLHPQKVQNHWKHLSEIESRFVFQKLLDAEKIPRPPYPPSHPLYGQIIEKIYSLKNSSDAMIWLSLLETRPLDMKQRLILEKLLDSILYKQDQPVTEDQSSTQQDCLILNRVQLAVLRGDIPLAMRLLAQLLGENSSDNRDPEMIQKAERLAFSILDDYRYDPAVLGMIHALFPRSVWSKLFAVLYLDHALSGEIREFEAIHALVQKSPAKGRFALGPQEIEVLRALSSRKIKTFEGTWRELIKKNQRVALELAFKLAERAISLPPPKRQRVQPYFDLIIEDLQKLYESGRNLKRGQEIISLLTSTSPPKNRYQEGQRTITGATVHAGAVQLGDHTNLTRCPHEWQAPRTLDSKPLLPRIKNFRSAAWEIR